MPEGPECHMIGTHMNKRLVGKKFVGIRVLGGRYMTHGPPNDFEILNQVLQETETLVESVQVKGKLIYILLTGDYAVLSTLGMSGSWMISKAPKHSDLVLDYGDSEHLWFTDPRHFGTLRIVTKKELKKILDKRGDDVLSEQGVSREKFFALCDKYSHWTLPKLLMDQNKISGIGNYLKAEILYAAKVDPTVAISEIEPLKIADVHKHMHLISRSALAKKGMSLQDYQLPDGKQGGFQFSLKVYKKKMDPNGHVVRRIQTTDKRTTHWVPEIQSSSLIEIS